MSVSQIIITENNIDKIINDYEIFISDAYNTLSENIKTISQLAILLKDVFRENDKIFPSRYSNDEIKKVYETDIFITKLKIINLIFDILSVSLGKELLRDKPNLKDVVFERRDHILNELVDLNKKFGHILLYKKTYGKLLNFEVE